jgi:predicted RNase H-like HicB family nuclease
MDNQFTAVFEKHDEWWVAYVEELPGANTQGKTIEEARENLKEAVQLVMECNREIAEEDLARRQTVVDQVVKEELLVST